VPVVRQTTTKDANTVFQIIKQDVLYIVEVVVQ